MAFKNSKAEKSDERGKAPDFVVRCRQREGSDFFFNAGAAWYVDVNGKQGISLKLFAYPVSGDGSFLLLPPKED